MLSFLLLPAFAEEPPPTEATEASAPATATYELESSSWLAVLVSYDRSALGGGHDHVVTPKAVSGQVTWNVADPSACKVSIEFPVDMLQVDPPGARKRFDLEGETSDGDKKSIKENLTGKHQLQASQYPKISYTSTSCKGTGEKVEVAGTLSIHGVKHPVTTTMTVKVEGSTFTAKGGFEATHADFGMEPYSALLGALRNDEKLKFQINVKGTAK